MHHVLQLKKENDYDPENNLVCMLIIWKIYTCIAFYFLNCRLGKAMVKMILCLNTLCNSLSQVKR